MSRRSGRSVGVDGEVFPFLDEPEGRRRRTKKRHDTYRKTEDAGRPRRPHYEELTDWDEDYEESDWQAGDDDDELDLAEAPNDDGEGDEGAVWDREDDDESDGEGRSALEG